MNLVRHNPWSLIEQLQRDLSQHNVAANNEDSGDVVTSNWAPAVDIKEEDKQYVLIADIPGVDPKDIDIHMENGMLSIRGERDSEKRDEKDGFKRIERAHGVFYRRFTMPDGVDPDGITASSDHGVLTVTIPKQEAVLARKIEVQ